MNQKGISVSPAETNNVSEVRCPGCGFETAPTFEFCPRCQRPLTTVRAPRSAASRAGQGVVWPVAIVGILVIVAIVVFMLVIDKNDPGDTRHYATLQTVFDKRIEQIIADPKCDAQTKEWAKRIKTDADAGKLERAEGLNALKNVATSETSEQRTKRLKDELCAKFSALIDDPTLPEEFKEIFVDARRNVYDMSDEEFAAANEEMESFLYRYEY